MSNYNIKEENMPWDQADYEAFRSSLSPERRLKDEQDLQIIFNEAANVPILEEALGWANSHGVKFFIDRCSIGCAGYMVPGAGVVALSEKLIKDKNYIIGTLVHEIRHIWQDYYNMIPEEFGRFQELYIQNSLIEADAHAHGELAREEYGNIKRGATIDKTSVLRKGFRSWYDESLFSRARSYGNIYSKYIGSVLGIDKVSKVDFNMEYNIESKFKRFGINIYNPNEVNKLGISFNGKTYFSPQSRDAFQKFVLQPSYAFNFYGKASGSERDLVTQIRKIEINKRLKLPLVKRFI